MVEPIAVVGGIAAISQLAKYGFQLYRSMSDRPEDLCSISDTVKYLLKYVDGHLEHLRLLSNRPGAAGTRLVIERSRNTALLLQRLLKPLAVDDKDSRTIRIKKCFAYQRKQRKASKYRADLHQHEVTLSLYFSTMQPEHTIMEEEATRQTVGSMDTLYSQPGISFGLPQRLDFIGRELTVDLVTQALADPALGRKACLVGLGGIGKSRTAIEIVHRIHDRTPGISAFWIQATNQGVFLDDLNRLCRQLKLPEHNSEIAMALSNVKMRLEYGQSGPWIFIIDDVDLALLEDPHGFIDALPRSNNGSLLLTSRNKQTAVALGPPQCTFSMEPMDTEEAHQLLASQLDPGLVIEENLSVLLSHLDHLPLAISQAAGCMRQHSMTPEKYVKLLEKDEAHKIALLTRGGFIETSTIHIQDLRVLSIVPIDTIRRQNEAAMELMFTMACLEPTNIPHTFFDDGRDALKLEQALGLLKSYFIIMPSPGDGTYNMPSLVRLCIRFYLKRISQLSFHTRNVLQLLSPKVPEAAEQYGRLSESNTYFPHVLEVWKEAVGAADEDYQTTFDRTVAEPLALRLSLLSRIHGRYQQAAALARYVIESASRSNDIGSLVTVLMGQASLAMAEYYLGDFRASNERIDTVFNCRTSILNTNYPLAIKFLRQKALSLYTQGKCYDAAGYYRNAIAISEYHYEPRDPRILDDRHGLSLCSLGQGRTGEAVIDLQSIFNNMMEIFGIRNPKTLSVLANIGCALQMRGDYDEAQEVFARALLGREDILGPDHPHTIQCRANLAEFYITKEDYPQAEAITRKSLRDHEARMGIDHHITIHIHNNLGNVLLKQGKFNEAASAFDQVIKRREEILGEDHLDTIASMYYACEAYYGRGNFEKALLLGRRVRLLRQKNLAEGHVDRREIEAKVNDIEEHYREWLSTETLVGSFE